ncbi:hypothetical protein [Chengkuizengella axinellae]|uniref:Uncharacterized protein n=1 Tax=Chengkuizengella axinellae TaxID=3064388 RepID=A0ABT9J0F1_9BACL|nr:hypothetical protein [Chengkuizengella sp. 2205SS18-9]MDP5275092.1 hypothetical protein [Chengkuizengella sp. 2205SS18-9]
MDELLKDKTQDAFKNMHMMMLKDVEFMKVELAFRLNLDEKEITREWFSGDERRRYKAFVKVMDAINKEENELVRERIGLTLMGGVFEDISESERRMIIDAQEDIKQTH